MAKLSASFGQRRLWMLAQLDGASRAYHLPLALRATGQLDRVALSRALDRIIARHEALRTTFTFVDGELLQSIGPEDSGFLLVDHDLRKETDAAMQLDLLIRLEIDAAFDMAKGPLIRGRLIAISYEEHVLIITMHHIVSDGWSRAIFARELRTLYKAYLLGKKTRNRPYGYSMPTMQPGSGSGSWGMCYSFRAIIGSVRPLVRRALWGCPPAP